MHGRKRNLLKGDEADAEKERLHQKVDLYRKARDEVFSKIKTGFDNEAMEISKAILSSNPDFTTLWNHRRRYLLQLLAKQGDETDGNSVEKLLGAELRLTQACLLKNPKSYSAWHHRYWALSRMRSPDFASEFALIDSALQEDDRNFHCWDYRRLVCRMANRAPEEELAFSEKKVNDDFSNFSAWHYRSKLLSQLRPGIEAGMPIRLDAFFEELSLSRNGIFTDPDDQSCWLYQNWLTTPVLGRVKLQRVSISTANGAIALCFNQAVALDMFSFSLPDHLSFSGNLKWAAPGNSVSSCLWYSQLPSCFAIDNFHCIIRLAEDESSTQIRLDDMAAFDHVRYWHAARCRNPKELELPANVKAALNENLSDIEQLITMEPENHWAHISAVMRMDVLGKKDHMEKMVAHLSKAMELDKKRSNFYSYWKDSLLIDSLIRVHLANRRDIPMVDLSAKNLSFLSISPDVSFLTSLDISNNSVRSIAPLSCLVHLRRLLAGYNRISSMEGLEDLFELELVDLTGNCIGIDGFVRLSNCKRLTSLLLDNNPICEDAEFARLPLVHGTGDVSASRKRQVAL